MALSLATIQNGNVYYYFASSVDGVAWRWWADPTTSGGIITLAEVADETAAAADAFLLAGAGDHSVRLELPVTVEARFWRVYHIAAGALSYGIYEFYPRRHLVTDDLDAEIIRGMTILAGQFITDSLFALSASMGALHMDGVIDITSTGGIYQGTGTFASPATGLKIYNSSGVGKISTYNATIEQIKIDTDGRLKWAAGSGLLDADGMHLLQGSGISQGGSVNLEKADGTLIGRVGAFYSSGLHHTQITSESVTGDRSLLSVRATTPGAATGDSEVQIVARKGVLEAQITITSDGATGGAIDLSANLGVTVSSDLSMGGGLNVGTATGATAGQVRGSGYLMASGAGTLPAFGVLAAGYDTGTPRGLLVAIDNGTYKRLDIEAIDLRLKYQTTNRIQINSTGLGLFGATPVARPAVTGVRTGTLAQLQTVVANLLTALGATSLGAITDSTT